MTQIQSAQPKKTQPTQTGSDTGITQNNAKKTTAQSVFTEQKTANATPPAVASVNKKHPHDSKSATPKPQRSFDWSTAKRLLKHGAASIANDGHYFIGDQDYYSHILEPKDKPQKQENSRKTLKDKQRQELVKIFNYEREHQGFIGKAWDSFKNFFKMNSGSKQIEAKLHALIEEKEINGEKVSLDDAKKAIKDYVSNQQKAVELASSVGAVATGAIVTAVTGGNVLVGSMAASAAKTGLKFCEAKVSDRPYESFTSDMLTGMMYGLGSGLGKKAPKLSALLGGSAFAYDIIKQDKTFDENIDKNLDKLKKDFLLSLF